MEEKAFSDFLFSELALPWMIECVWTMPYFYFYSGFRLIVPKQPQKDTDIHLSSCENLAKFSHICEI